MSRVEHVERVEPCPFCGKGTAVEHVRYDNCFVVRCLYCGYTSGHIASERGAMIRHNKLCRALPKPDPDWKATCAKCHDGEIEPDCEYYGEPNGCNSPIWGEHPQSAPVGDAAAMREALEAVMELFWDMQVLGRSPISNKAYTVKRKVKAALAAPPRNCDRFGGDIEELREACLRERGLNPDEDFPEIFCEWLLAAAKKGGAQ